MTRELEITKKGWPCLWEEGGAKKNASNATIVCDYDGKPKYPVVLKIRGNLACSKHALLPVFQDDTIIEVTKNSEFTKIDILRILEIKKKEKVAKVECIAHYENGRWDKEKIYLKYKEACDKAIEKANCFHCKEPHFVDLSRHRFY